VIDFDAWTGHFWILQTTSSRSVTRWLIAEVARATSIVVRFRTCFDSDESHKRGKGWRLSFGHAGFLKRVPVRRGNQVKNSLQNALDVLTSHFAIYINILEWGFA
jgi:hypothetical protein